jgi:hypothetical protein
MKTGKWYVLALRDSWIIVRRLRGTDCLQVFGGFDSADEERCVFANEQQAIDRCDVLNGKERDEP